MPLPSSTLRLLLSSGSRGTAATPPRMALGITIVPVRDPIGEIEMVSELFDRANGRGGGRRSSWYTGRSDAPDVSVDRAGQVRVNGRVCCGDLLQDLDRRAHLLQLPYDLTCEDCGAAWRVQQGVTYE